MSTLNRYDLWLCGSVCGNVATADDGEAYATALRRELDPRLADYLGVGASADDDLWEWTLLTAADLEDLASAADDLSDRFILGWLPDEALHGRSVSCVKEIRENLTAADAETWSRRSAEFAARLEADGLGLAEGVRVTSAWIMLARRYLSAMGRRDLLPRPAGDFPTPSKPSSAHSSISASAAAGGAADKASATAPPTSKGKARAVAAGLPPEVGLREAAEMLGCDRKTVLRMIRESVLPWRDAATASSSRPLYRLRRDDVVRLRTTYHTGIAASATASRPAGRRRGAYVPRLITLNPR